MKINNGCLLQKSKKIIKRTGLMSFFVTLILGIAIFIGLDQYTQKLLLENAHSKLELSIHPVFNSLSQKMNVRLGYLEAFTRLVETNSIKAQPEQVATYDEYLNPILLKDQSGSSEYYYYAEGGVITYAFPDTEFDFSGKKISDLIMHSTLIENLTNLNYQSSTITIGKILGQEGLQLIIIAPISGSGKNEKIAIFSADFDRLLADSGLYDVGFGLDVTIYDEFDVQIFGSASVIDENPIAHTVATQSGIWKIYVAPEGGWHGFIAQTLLTYRITSLLILLLVFTLIQFFIYRQKNLEVVVLQRSQELEAEILERIHIQEELRKSRDQLQKAEKMGSLGTWEWDSEREEIKLSSEIHRIFGLPGEDFHPTIQEAMQIIHAEDWKKIKNVLRDLERNKKSRDFEIRVHCPGGTIASGLVIINPRVDEHGEVFGYWGTIQDITHRKHLDQLLKQTNRSLKMVSLCNQALVHATDEKRLLNDICKIIVSDGGYSLAFVAEAKDDEVKSVKILSSCGDDTGYLERIELRWDDSPRGNGPSGRAIKSGKTIISEQVSTDSTVYWKEYTKSAQINSLLVIPISFSIYGRGIIQVCTEREVTFSAEETKILKELADDIAFGITTLRGNLERDKSAEALRISEEKFANAFQISPDSISISRLSDGEFIEVNQGFTRMTGYSHAECVGRKSNEINIWKNPDEREVFINQLMKDSQIVNYQAEFRAKDNSIITGLVSARQIDIHGDTCILSITRDISERVLFEKELEEIDEKFQLITNNMEETIWLMDLDLNTIYLSPSIARYSGYEYGEVRNIPFFDFLTPDSVEEVKDLMLKELTPERLGDKNCHISTTIEASYFKKDRQVDWVEVTTTVIRDNDGKPVSLLNVARNIAERKKMEQALDVLESRWQYALEGTGDGVWDWNLSTNSVYYSKRVREMFGDESDDTWQTYDDWLERIHPDDTDLVISELNKYTRQSIPKYSMEYRVQKADGSYCWILDRGKIIEFDENHLPKRMIGIFSDLTDYRSMQQNLKENEEKFRLLAERSTDIISLLSIDGVYTYISPACLPIFGYLPAEMIGRSLLEYIHPEDKTLVSYVINQLDLIDDIQPLQYRIRTNAGEYIWMETTAQVIKDVKSGKPVEIQATARNITERVMAEEALRESEEKFRSVITQSQDGIILIDEEGGIIEWSRGEEKVTGISRYEALGSKIWDIQYKMIPEPRRTPEMLEFIKKTTINSLASGNFNYENEIQEQPIVDVAGKTHIVQTLTFPIHSPHGYMAGSISRDVTEIKKAEEALQKSEVRLRFITDNMIDMVSYINPEQIFEYVSPSVIQVTGFEGSEQIGQSLSQYIHPEDLTAFLVKLNQSINDGKKSIQLEYRYKHKTDGYIWMESMANLIFNDEMIYTGAVLGTRDITDKKIASDALKESESRYRTLARNFPNGAVMLFDNELRYQVADGTGLSRINLDRRQLEGKTIFEVYTPETIAVLEPYYRAVLRGRAEVFELQIEDVTYEVYAVPITDESGQITYGMVMTQDVSDRKHAVLTLQSRAKYLSELNKITLIALEESDLIIMMQEIVDILAEMFEADQCYITGWDAEKKRPIPLSSSGKLRDSYTTILAEDGERTLTQTVIESGSPLVVEDLYNTEAISARLAAQFPSKSVLVLPLIGSNENLGAVMIGFSGDHKFTDDEIQRAEQVAGQIALAMFKVELFQEVQSSNIKLEKRVAERTEDLEAKNKELETFTYSVSHDLKAPLRGIDGYSRLLIEDHSSQLDEEGRTFLKTIRAATGQMNQLIEDLLSYSRLERRSITKEAVDAIKLVENLVLERKDDFRRNNIDLVLEIAPVEIFIDRKAIEQALRNLLDNAIKFSSGNANPRICINLSSSHDDKYVLFVEDNGIGIDMKYSEKIFDIFQRLHLPEEYPGTGIGLALVKKAMQRIGGRVWVESVQGVGSKFYLEIPV